MNSIELSNVGPKVNTSEIEKFEVDFNISFPVEYKDFLLRNNGGCPKELIFTSDFIEVNPTTSEIINQATDVERFFSLSEITFEYEDIIYFRKTTHMVYGFVLYIYTDLCDCRCFFEKGQRNAI